MMYPLGDASLYEQHDLLRSSGDRMKDLRARVTELESQLDMAIKKNDRWGGCIGQFGPMVELLCCFDIVLISLLIRFMMTEIRGCK